MDERESRSLLDILFQQAQIPEYQFRHHWAPHTLIMWDNRSTQHYAIADYGTTHRRVQRVTTSGDVATGVDGSTSTALKGDASHYYTIL